MSDKIRVLQLVNGELYGGAERIQEIILANLDLDIFEPYCIAVMDGDFVQRARDEGLPVKVLPMRGKVDLTIIEKVRSFAVSNDIDLLHTHTVRTNVIGRLAGKLSGVPVVSHVHSSPLYETDHKLKSKINQYLESFTRSLSDRFICVSNQLKGQLVSEGVDQEKIAVIKNGVELDRFTGNDETYYDDSDEGSTFLNSDLPTVTMVAYFRPLKGVEVLLKSLSLEDCLSNGKTDLPAAYLVGEFQSDYYRREIERKVKELDLKDRVHFVGFSGRVEEILRASNLFVLPSLFGEGIPVSILEAMAMEVPVIASSVGGIPEIIKDGETGTLVPPGDEEVLAKAIADALSDYTSFEEMAIEARKFVEKNHNVSTMVNPIEDMYLGLVG